MRNIEYWLSDKDLNNIYTSSYWNDIEEEKKKGWWIADGEYKKCLDYLKSTNLLSDFLLSEAYIKEYTEKNENIKIADLASGSGWISALLSKLENINEVIAVEISKHRLETLFEHSVKMMKGNGDKISRYLGSFYDIKLEPESVDIVYMSQAFHHADKPMQLLIESDRILKKGGRIILVGEHYIHTFRFLKRILGYLKETKKISFDFYELFTPDPVLGDHYYRHSDYHFMFKSFGYDLKYEITGKGSIIYVADKNN
jgi:ubiquinone/menaquinone biosynthesis C-methylase UbiE